MSLKATFNSVSPHQGLVPGLVFGNAGTEHQSERDFSNAELFSSSIFFFFSTKRSETETKPRQGLEQTSVSPASIMRCVEAKTLEKGSQLGVLLQVTESIVFVLFFAFCG